MKEEVDETQMKKGEDEDNLTWKDKKFITVMVVMTVGFSLRGGEYPGCVFATLKQIISGFIYGFGMVFLFIGLTKKTFKYNPTKVQITRWIAALTALFAFSEFAHEGYLMLTGQIF